MLKGSGSEMFGLKSERESRLFDGSGQDGQGFWCPEIFVMAQVKKLTLILRSYGLKFVSILFRG